MSSEDTWSRGEAYERFVGRWSRLVAHKFVGWLEVEPGRDWLDVGCGAGALTEAILEHAHPESMTGVDLSAGFLARARAAAGRGAAFVLGDAMALPFADGRFRATVSGLALNFAPQPRQCLGEIARVTLPGGLVAAYVWDYSGKMEMLRAFWDAAVAVDPGTEALDEGLRFPICAREPLVELCRKVGLQAVESRAVDVPTHFSDFDDYWLPFLGGQGPAPRTLPGCRQISGWRSETPAAALPAAEDGSISLTRGHGLCAEPSARSVSWKRGSGRVTASGARRRWRRPARIRT